MTFFVQPTTPSKPKNRFAVKVALVYSLILVIMVVTQLFSFEAQLVNFENFVLPGGQPTAYFLASAVVTAEVFALPFLLRMQASVLARFMGMALGWFVAFFWTGISVWLVLNNSRVMNIGVFGEVVSFGPGLLSILFGIVLCVLSVWASWGMWPGTPKRVK